MKTLYIECAMGVAGDMLSAALLELLDDPQAFIDEVNGIGLHGVSVSAQTRHSHGMRGTHLHVEIGGHAEHDHHAHAEETQSEHHHHHARSLSDVMELIETLAVSARVKQDAAAVYRMIADAEAHAHGMPVAEVHFHELGMLDAIMDIVMCAMLMERLRPDAVAASRIRIGGGTVRTAHGVLPVPAPATAQLLEGLPIEGGPIDSELTTPTGAALINYFAGTFGELPRMRILKTGVGLGSREFDRPNCVRAILGADDADDTADSVTELSCNLDDMTGEAVAFATERLLADGALDAYIVPIQMKKGRPAVMLCALCRDADAERLAACMLTHTTTFGVRRTRYARYILQRRTEERQTPYGPVRVKIGEGYGVTKCKAEYEDAAQLAKAAGVSLAQVLESIDESASLNSLISRA